jgi:hypothetical protein
MKLQPALLCCSLLLATVTTLSAEPAPPPVPVAPETSAFVASLAASQPEMDALNPLGAAPLAENPCTQEALGECFVYLPYGCQPFAFCTSFGWACGWTC